MKSDSDNIKIFISPINNKPTLILGFIEPVPLVLIIINIVFFLIRLQFLSVPFERDEGKYCFLGQLILDGKIPYKSFYEMKPPGLFFAYAFITLLGGNSLEGVHLIFIFINLITNLLLFQIGKKLMDSVSGIIISTSYSILSLGPHISGFTVQAEQLVAFFVVCGVYYLFCALENNKTSNYFLWGLSLGCSSLIKQTGIFFIFLSILYIFFYNYIGKKEKRKITIKNITSFFIGAFSLILLTILYLIYNDSLKEFIYWNFTFSSQYISTITLEQGILNLTLFFKRIINNYKLFWFMSAVGIFLSFMKSVRYTEYKKIFLLLFLIISFLSIIPGLRFYGHYWIVLIPSLSLLIGFSFYALKKILNSEKNASHYPTGLYIFFIFMVVLNFYNLKDFYFNPDKVRLMRTVYGMNPFIESKQVADFIKPMITKKEPVVVFGSEPEIYFYTQTRSPSVHSDIASLLTGFPKHRQFQMEFIKEVELSKPRLMILFNNPFSLAVLPGTDTTVFSWFKNYSEKYYNLTGLVQLFPNKPTVYSWGENATQNGLISDNFIVLYERRDEAINEQP